MISCIIVDDEPKARMTIFRLLADNCPQIKVLDMVGSVKQAVQSIEEKKPELVFLDIQLNDGTGFDILAQLNFFDFKVIFATAYDQYALEAIKFSALDYLLKPINAEELITAVEKASKLDKKAQSGKINLLLENLNSIMENKIAIGVGDGTELLPFDKIIRLEADGSYTKFVLKQDRVLHVSRHLKEFESLLRGKGFYRTHKSHVINLKFLKKIVKKDGGHVEMEDDSVIPCSRAKREELLSSINNF